MNRLRTLLKWTLFAVVLAYVCHHGYELWRQSDVRAPLATVLSRLVSFLSDVLVAAALDPTIRNRLVSPKPPSGH